MRRPHAQLTVRRLMVVVAIVAVLLVALIVPVGRRFEFVKLRRRSTTRSMPCITECRRAWASRIGNVLGNRR